VILTARAHLGVAVVLHVEPDTVFVYDPAKDRWEKGPSLTRARFHHAVAQGRDGKIHAIGGHASTFTGNAPTATVEMLDTAKQPRPEGW
jgi:hypothetical protein